MGCLDGVNNARFSIELVNSITVLYTYKGKDFYYEEILKNFMRGIVTETIEDDIKYSAILLNLNVTDARLKALIKKDSSPKTKDEEIVSNLKTIFKLIQEMGTDLDLTSNEFLKLGTRIFGDRKFAYSYDLVNSTEGLISEKKKVSKREDFEGELKKYINAINILKMESTQVITRFYIDMVQNKYFTIHNEYMALLITYCLLVSRRFNVFKYVSFFKSYANKMDDFRTSLAKANYGYKEGFSDVLDLNNDFIKMMLDGYREVEGMTQDSRYSKEIKLNKIDAAASAIMSLDQNFTKNDIKIKCPYMSDSTINRALEKLKEDGKIISNGTGRSATWTKLINQMDLSRRDKQINIFEMIDDEE